MEKRVTNLAEMVNSEEAVRILSMTGMDFTREEAREMGVRGGMERLRRAYELAAVLKSKDVKEEKNWNCSESFAKMK